MVHSFSNCPLRASYLLVTNHLNQHIVTATDEVLDLLGYSMSDIVDHSIQQCLDLTLSTDISCIPQCKIRHANGNMLDFQVCIHQDPLGSAGCLDYWLIRLSNTTAEKVQINATSVLRLSPFGTIEQIQASPLLKQSVNELLGRPVMAFVYKDDVELLCSHLSMLCSVHRRESCPVDPLFIRWSSLPYLLSTPVLDYEDSLNYDWMSFTFMSNTTNRPICILRPLLAPPPPPCEESLALHFSVFNQLLDYCSYVIQVAKDSKIYITDFYHHVVYSTMELLSIFMQQQQTYPLVDASCTTSRNNNNNNNSSSSISSISIIWDFIKSNYILQRSLTVLELAGFFDQQHHFETVSN